MFQFFTTIAPEGVAVTTDISSYLDFVLALFLAFGVAFELPIAIVLMVATGITTVIWCIGYAPDFSWIKVPAAFDDSGYPKHERGVTASPGLYFLGLPWQHTWGSGRIYAIAEDAEHVVTHLADELCGSGPARERPETPAGRIPEADKAEHQ